ncbi:MAG: hypothetical protein ACYDH2_13605, partial [Anaerolineaceae bacterium]
NFPTPNETEIATSSQFVIDEGFDLPDSTLAISVISPQSGMSLPIGSQVFIQISLSGVQSPYVLKIWQNGALLGEKQYSEAENDSLTTIDWIMGTDETTLVFSVEDTANSFAVSKAIKLVPTAGPITSVQEIAADGETRQSISEQYDLPLNSIQLDALPDYDPTALIPKGTSVNILVNGGNYAELQSFLPMGFSSPTDEEKNKNLPQINGYLQDGNASLILSDPTGIATVLLLYRSDSQTGSFKLVHKQNITSGVKDYSFSDSEPAKGTINYYIASETPEGYQLGNMLHIDANIDQSALAPPSIVSTGDGRLRIFEGVGMVYFYASINDEQAVRVPDLGFIKVENGLVDLNQSLAHLTKEAKFPVWLDMEVWTWTGSTAQKLGEIHSWLENTKLAVCVDKNQNCATGSGEFFSRELTEADAYSNVPDGSNLSFPWKTSLSGNPQALVQVSLTPFANAFEVHPQGLVYSAAIEGNCNNDYCGSVFCIEFANLLGNNQENPVLYNQQPGAQTLTTTEDEPFLAVDGISMDLIKVYQDMEILSQLSLEETTPEEITLNNFRLSRLDFYVRVTPASNGQPSGAPSNTVVIHYGEMGAASTVEWFPTVEPPPQPVQIYDAKIIEFVPPIPPSLGWGCVYVTAVEPFAFNASYYKKLMEDHEPYCPSVFKGQGEQSWYESLWDFATSTVSWISQKYAEIKSSVISGIAGALDGLGVCSNCEAYIALALDAGLVALGIPPSLPDMSKLTDMGIDYLVEQAAQTIGVPCDAACMEIIRNGVKDMVDQMDTQTVSSYQDTEEAHRHGREPLFVPYGVSVEAALETSWQMPSLRISVTRKPGSENNTSQQLEQIESTLYVLVDGYNDSTGQTYTEFNCWSGGCDLINPSPDCTAIAVPGCPHSVIINTPLEGQLFQPIIFTLGSDMMPHLQPGEVKELNLALLPADYWIPGHEDNTTYTWHDDWGHLYEGGTGFFKLDITARACLQNISGQPPSCSYTFERTDYMEIENPDTSTWGFNQMYTPD